MQPHLGLDEVEHRKKLSQKEWKKFSAWRKGYKAGRKGAARNDNPYKKQLSSKVLSLLRKAARWEIGWEEAAYTPTPKRLREMRRRDIKIKEETKEKHKHHHKHREHKHRKHRHHKKEK